MGIVLIKARNIIKRYDHLEVLKGVDLTIEKGEVLTIVGPSGAGKSTLLHVLGSLERPEEGSVSFNDVDIYSLASNELARFRNRNVGFVFQFHQLLPEFTLRENVAMPALIGGKERNGAFASADKLIDYLGLTPRALHRPGQLSGGERQRAAVARALVNNPAVVFADEPSGSLDSRNRRELHQLFFDLRRDFGHTFVIVTHDESLATDSDRVVKMADGRIDEIVCAAGREL